MSFYMLCEGPKPKIWEYSISLYCDSGKLLLNYMNIIFEKQPSEHIFISFRAGSDYHENYLKI